MLGNEIFSHRDLSCTPDVCEKATGFLQRVCPSPPWITLRPIYWHLVIEVNNQPYKEVYLLSRAQDVVSIRTERGFSNAAK